MVCCLSLDNEEDLAKKTIEMLSDEGLRAKLAKGALQTAEENTIQVWTKKLVELYSECRSQK